MDGIGTYTWPDGRKYIGEFLNDQTNGQGSYFWNDGRKFEGNWKLGK